MSEVNNRRRRIITDPDLQKRIVLAGAWPPCMGMAMAIVLLGYLCSRLGSEALESGVELPSLPWLFLAIAGFLVVAMGFVVWASVRISHRVAGPTQNFRRILARTRSGDLSARVNLRDGDYLTAVADLVNEHLQWLQEHPPQGLANHVDEVATAEDVEAMPALPLTSAACASSKTPEEI